MLFDPPPKPNCSHCKGNGYVLKTVEERAIAEQCRCIPYCKRCTGTGQIAITRDGVQHFGRCRCQKLPDRIRLFNLARIPAIHAANDLGNFDKSPPGPFKALVACSRWLTRYKDGSEDRGLILTGSVGRGKTHLLIGLVKELIFSYGRAVRFIEFSRLLSDLREAYNQGKSDSQILQELVSIPILAIDELGKGRANEWELSIIDELISRRYNAKKMVIGTTNYLWNSATGVAAPNLALVDYSKQSLGDRVGDRVFSRLQQMCKYQHIDGDDYRSLGNQRA